MNLATLTPDLMTIADIIDPPLPRDESKTHVSYLVNEAAKIAGKRAYDGEPSEVGWAMMAMGRMWEVHARAIVIKYAEDQGLWLDEPAITYNNPQGNMVAEMDGVVGTLDGKIYEGTTLSAIMEAKCRFTKSSDPRDTWNWMLQVKAYCHMESCQAAWMPVLYLPLRGEPKPEFQLHFLTFTKLELEENWQMLMNVKKMGER